MTHETALQPIDPANPEHHPTGIDMTARDVEDLTRFVAHIPAPVERTIAEASFVETDAGEDIFNRVGCVTCHVPDVYPVTDLFSDLLLHDMGEDLQAPSPAGGVSPIRARELLEDRASNRGFGTSFQQGGSIQNRRLGVPVFPTKGFASNVTPAYYGPSSFATPAPMAIARPETPQFPRGQLLEAEEPKESTWDAAQREWRTPPLWGVASTAPYLHDGRAETLRAAILWHGGEALESREQFAELPRNDQDTLLAFLSTLQAP